MVSEFDIASTAVCLTCTISCRPQIVRLACEMHYMHQSLTQAQLLLMAAQTLGAHLNP